MASAAEVQSNAQIGPEPPASLEDQTLIIFASLMEGGTEDEETCKDLSQLTKLLNDDAEARIKDKNHPTICQVIDSDCVDTLLGYLDLRQADVVRSHALLASSAYLKAAGQDGSRALSTFFFDRVKRGTYDDYIVAFCVATATFPIAPDLTAELFLSEGFAASLGPLMRRKWKSRKVETACLEMLNAASMNQSCREVIQKYCVEWLEEVVDQEPTEVVRTMSNEYHMHAEGGSINMRRHSEQVQNLAAVILAKLRAVPTKATALDSSQPKVDYAVSSMEDLTHLFTNMILRGEESHGIQHALEGLAYASIQSSIKESIVKDSKLVQALIKILSERNSPTTAYGALSIFVNLTRYQPVLTEEQKKMNQLKAYAAAEGKQMAGQDAFNDDEHVAVRCKAVFEAGLVPVLVSQGKHSSSGSLAQIVSIVHSLSAIREIRGQLAQQGAVSLMLAAWSALPEADTAGKRTAAQALARILISTNPALVFGGSRANAIHITVRALVYILPPDPASEVRDLLPSFESLMALTNLASMQEETVPERIVAMAWPQIEEQLLSSNALISKAAVELVCNLMQSPEGIALYADETPQARNRLHILLALADAEDEGTRSAAGGALASLTGFDSVVRAITERERGIKVILSMCVDDDESLRHRGVYTIFNLANGEGDAAKAARAKITEENGVETLKECLKKSRRPEVLQVTAQALKILLGQK